MPGSVIDLAVPGTRFPDPIVVDTNLIIERLLGSFHTTRPGGNQSQRAVRFFLDLAATHGTGIVTPTIFQEFVHATIKAVYRQQLLRLGGSLARQQRYGVAINNWVDLYKADASILRNASATIDQLRQLLVANDLLLVPPDELGPIPSGRSFDEELVWLVGTYGLDANDALILMETQRCGVSSVITFDQDMQRASTDFDIYTWL